MPERGCLIVSEKVLYFIKKVANNSYLCTFVENSNVMRKIKVIHVHLLGKRRDLYFGSIAAVFTVLSPQDVGCTYNYLRRAGLSGGGTVVTKNAIIKQSMLITSPRKDDCK